MRPTLPFLLSHLLPHLLLIVLLFPTPTPTQQIGSFFTAIQYNNGALPQGASSCSDMGGSAQGYCCQSGHSCAWDDSGAVACCAPGASCGGVAGGGAGGNNGKYDGSGQGQGQGQWNGAGAGSGVGAGAGAAGGGNGCNTCCNTCNNEQTTTVYPQPVPSSSYTSYYQQPTPTTSYAGGGVIVPTSTSSSLPNTLTVTPVGAGGVRVTTTVPVDQACGGAGYTTLTQANVGAPVRTVGCFVIFEAKGVRGGGELLWWGMGGVVAWLGWWSVGLGW